MLVIKNVPLLQVAVVALSAKRYQGAMVRIWKGKGKCRLTGITVSVPDNVTGSGMNRVGSGVRDLF